MQGWCSCEAPSPKASDGGKSVWEEKKVYKNALPENINNSNEMLTIKRYFKTSKLIQFFTLSHFSWANKH